MTRYLWLSVSVCCAAALWSACGPPPNSCQVSADCFPDEVCVSNLCVPKPSEDGGTEVSDAGTGGGDGTTGGGDGTQSGGGSATGGGSAVGGGDPTGGGQGVDAGMPDCEAGDTLPCCSGRGVQTCDSDGTWSACDATVSSESCNGIDDDCNGTVDNDVLFSMPDGGVAMNVTCTIGVGACESSGSLACATDGGVVCGAAVIEATTEICDDIDNDCDGQTDEGTKVLCMIDADNDHYAGSAMQQEFCPDTTRSDFGNCPVGYVATSLGIDCNDSDPSAFLEISVRMDSDGDTYCTNAPAITKCTNGLAPAGYTLEGACKPTTDCDDAARALHLNMDVRPDRDHDGYCDKVATTRECTDGSTPPFGFKELSACHYHDVLQIGGTTRVIDEDCNDTPNQGENIYRNELLMTDADLDSYCSADPGVLTCIGATVPTGKRTTNSCMHVSGSLAVDCRDTNSNATTQCSFSQNTANFLQACPSSTTSSKLFTWSCGTGFHSSAATLHDDNSTDGDDAFYIASSVSIALYANNVYTQIQCRTGESGFDYYYVTYSCEAD